MYNFNVHYVQSAFSAFDLKYLSTLSLVAVTLQSISSDNSHCYVKFKLCLCALFCD